VNAAVGFVYSRQNGGALGGERSSIDLALDASMCRNLTSERICARVSRRNQTSVLGGSPTSTTAALDYYRRLGAKDTIQGSVGVSRSRFRFLEEGGRSTFYTLSGSYDRQINDRFFAGVNVAARKLATTGQDPNADIGGSLFVRYRIGDVR
jgi:hypothetical protein